MLLAVTRTQEQIPQEVEQLLVGWIAELSDSMGVHSPKLVARRMRTVIAGREGAVTASANDALAFVRARHPDAFESAGEEEVVRLVVPVGRTGLQRIVVDLYYPRDWHEGKPMRLRAYGKEGLFNRHPTERTAESVFLALSKPKT
jgi:hypothetical protein